MRMKYGNQNWVTALLNLVSKKAEIKMSIAMVTIQTHKYEYKNLNTNIPKPNKRCPPQSCKCKTTIGPTDSGHLCENKWQCLLSSIHQTTKPDSIEKSCKQRQRACWMCQTIESTSNEHNKCWSVHVSPVNGHKQVTWRTTAEHVARKKTTTIDRQFCQNDVTHTHTHTLETKRKQKKRDFSSYRTILTRDGQSADGGEGGGKKNVGNDGSKSRPGPKHKTPAGNGSRGDNWNKTNGKEEKKRRKRQNKDKRGKIIRRDGRPKSNKQNKFETRKKSFHQKTGLN